MFCPAGKLDWAVVGCGFTSGAETDLRPATVGHEGDITPLGTGKSSILAKTY